MATTDESAETLATHDLGPRRGRSPIRLSTQERQARDAGLRAALERMAATPADPNEDDGDLFRALDESHPGRFELERYY